MRPTDDWASNRDGLRDIAEADDITLVVGAGSSFESGLPDWETLLRKLLTAVALNKGVTQEDASLFTDWTLGRDGLTAGGAMVKSALGEDFERALQGALYEDVTDPTAGETAHAAAILRWQLLGTDSEIVTTNYDTLLESALRDRAPKKSGVKIKSIATGTVQRQADIVVRHVHGMLDAFGKTKGKVILSEDDYHLMQDRTAWQEKYFQERLSDTTCFFVGSSLADPNLLRYLTRTKSSLRHAVLFARQQDAGRYDEVKDSVAQLRESMARRRWESMGVRPILLRYYFESAQAVLEVERMRRLGDDYVPFEDRLHAWRGEWSTLLPTRRITTFCAQQDQLRELLATTVRELESVVGEDAGIEKGRRERLGASLWIYDPVKHQLTNWASSDRVWREPSTLEPVPVHWASDFVAVKSFCSGSIVDFSTAGQPATRWNHVLAAPLYLWSDDWGRLPVGSLTLASTAAPDRSFLRRGLPAIRSALGNFLPSLAEVVRPSGLHLSRE